MSDKRILYISQEISPYTPQTEQSEVGREMPQSMHKSGYEVRTFMPKYGTINERRNQLHEVIRLSGVNIIIDDNDHPLIIKVASMQPSRIQVYFVDNDDYFQKLASDSDTIGSNREDNDERNIFFARGTMETARKLRWEPGIVHCSGLVTTLAPLYLRRMYADDPVFRNSKIVYTIEEGSYKDNLDARMFEKLRVDGIPEESLSEFDGKPIDSTLLHKIAIANSDGVIIQTKEENKELEEYIAAKGLPAIKLNPGATDAEKLKEFYTLLRENE